MPRILIAATAILLPFLVVAPAPAQQATEQYIPLGQSPGLSPAQTYTGEIVSADAGARTVTFGTGAERHSVRVTQNTRIWIDRSKFGLPSTVGAFGDLESGRLAEVKYADGGRRDTADWIKVVPESAN